MPFFSTRRLIQYRLPRGYIPDTDQISRIVAQDQFIIDLITTSLLRVPSGTYKAGDNMFIDGIECEALYIPHSSDLVDLPPVVAEIQHTYCLNVYKRFHILPILFIVCTSKTKSKTLRDLFKSVQNNCFMLTKQSIDPFIDNHDTKELDSLVVFQNIISIDRWDDPTNAKLYLKTENDKKIMTTVFDNPSRAHQYAEAGRHYNASLEVRHNEARIKQYTSRSNNINVAS
ncbi:uncharacterized protein B0P05DRAFT_558839 [Gilbertella persicaria]|uniref:uncharacterized protein n=1 Tax=Gilbertella persicaria TaxID=101096 RepID=UPI00221EED86|nr:uncharacterized protein B0P05DRAFT_558839 [Gilbertella persicaria]KAI8059039.1 hypothetical protein B0P05DRAFT_558839 [Gilbertella persicaria]